MRSTSKGLFVPAVLTTACALLLPSAAPAAPPLVHGAVPPHHERPSEGVAVWAPGASPLSTTDDSMRVCMLRVEFLEDFTTETTGNGLFDLDADPPRDRAYFEDLGEAFASYYLDVSGGALEIRVDVYPQSLNGAYGMPHQMIYYGDDASFRRGWCELLRDAVDAADVDVDFSSYDAVVVAHAGAGQEADILGDSPGDIGSVFLTLTDLIYHLPGAGFGYQGIPTGDGVYVREGTIIPETETQDGFGLGLLGTFCHEFAHQLGLPDLYDTMTGRVAVGGWALMGYGQWIMSGFWPPAPCAWSRVFAGWTPVRLVEGPGTFELTAGDSVLRVPLTGTEYLLIENRLRDPDGDGQCGVHERDFGLPGSGVLIWHIDRTRLGPYVDANLVNVDMDHKGVDLEEADGIQDFDYSLPDIYGYEGSEWDPWFEGGYAWLFGPGTEPGSDASWGGRTFVTVEVLDPPGETMRVRVGMGGSCEGWPVTTDPLRWGPLVWPDPDGEGDRLVVVSRTGYARAWRADGSGPEPVGLDVTAPPVAGDPSGGGASRLLVCEGDGEVHLRSPDWTEPDGWPVTLPGGAVGAHALVSGRLGLVAVADETGYLHVYDGSGRPLSGWPVALPARSVGIAVYPDQESPGLVSATADGRVYLWELGGDPAAGWPRAPGSEATGLPLCADVDRDGEAEVVVVSGGALYCWGRGGETSPGFPAELPDAPLGSPALCDLDGDGRLETAVTTGSGISVIGPSGAPLSDWPLHARQDTLVAAYRPGNRGTGGSGFLLTGLPDGRIAMYGPDARPVPGYPLAAGDLPVGAPLLWDPGDGFRTVAADSSGNLYCWVGAPEPEGWFPGLSSTGEGCWWSDRLPALAGEGGFDESSFFVYPNPVTEGEGTVRFVPGEDSSWEVRIFNMAGDLVTFESGTAPGGAAWEVPWTTGNLAPGVYFVSLYLEGPSGPVEAIFHAAVVN